MTKAYSRFLTVFFCLFLGGLLAWHTLLPDRSRSETENRTLTQTPVFSWAGLLDGSYTKQVESYFADQFPLRDEWTVLKARAEQAIGKTEFNGVYLCGDTLISKVERPAKDLPSKNLDYVTRLENAVPSRVTLGLIPSAAEIWRDKLPFGATSWDQQAFLSEAAATGIPTVDFSAALAQHAQEPIFYRTDHHWTTLGAYYGYVAVMESLGREALPMDAFTPQTVSDSFNGTLYSSSGIHWLKSDTMEFWVSGEGLHVTSWRSGSPEKAELYDESYLSKKDKYSAFLGGNQPLCVITNDNPDAQGKILLVRDSYSDALAPFLARQFSEVHLLDLRYYRVGVAQYAAEQEIDDILVLYSIPNFITDKNLVFLAP